MKICESWLREWVSTTQTAQALSQQMTMAGLEVDSLYPVAGVFTGVVVAHVLQTRPHPQADKLTLCEVDCGEQEPLQVVCGAKNVRPNLKVALARVGAKLPNDFQIKEAKLRGELSMGMLCSTTELGIDEQSDGILELPQDAPIGVDLREYLQLNDHVFDIDLTPNRADCLSVLGIARDIAALNKVSLKAVPETKMTAAITDKIAVELQASQACPRYASRVIKGIRTDAETPLWMKERLRRSGLRPVYPVVDVLNYVMLELGQPMHAFALDTIKGAIHVRYARDAEAFTLLDGQKVSLDNNVLMIADDEKSLAMAGVMGGENSAVQIDTADVFLESAFFNPMAITGVARRFGLNTDAAQRFERGVDPSIQSMALEYATQLILEIAGGQPGPVMLAVADESLPQACSFSFRPERVERLTGLKISTNDIHDILQRLGLSVAQTNSDSWQITPPMHRFDLQQEVDVVEEVIRIVGYDKIESNPIHSQISPGQPNQLDQCVMCMSQFLVARGYRETISYSFVDPDIQHLLYPDEKKLTLLNPISSDLSQMRSGLWGGLVAAMVHNLHRQQSALKLFEVGVAFHYRDNTLTEIPSIAGLITGVHGHLSWNDTARPFDFYDMKGDLEALFAHFNLHNIRFENEDNKALHPGKSARIYSADQLLGRIGALHPALMDALDLEDEVLLFECTLASFTQEHTPYYQSISKYPQTRRDLSLMVDEAVTAAQIEAAVRAVVEADCLKSFHVFDVYRGESIPQGKKSLAIALTLQNVNRTLVDAEIQSVVDKILQHLEKTFSVVLRAE